MSNILDFLQSASNEAAGAVSAPVDGIAWLLRKAGIPVPEDAFGSSDWMEKKGLTRPVQQSAASLAGQTAGLLSPVAAAAKAPQIARGLLQAGDNLAARATQGAMGQRGAIDTDALRSMFPDIDFSLMQAGDRATLGKVVVPKEARGQGQGSEFMAELVRRADADGARLGLTPSTDFGGSKSRLEAFYKRFGFAPNKGKNKDFEFMEAMVRPPRSQGN